MPPTAVVAREHGTEAGVGRRPTPTGLVTTQVAMWTMRGEERKAEEGSEENPFTKSSSRELQARENDN